MLALSGARTRQARFLLTTDNLQLPALRKEKTDQLRNDSRDFSDTSQPRPKSIWDKLRINNIDRLDFL